MDEALDPLSPESLLEHTSYLRAVARALVRDEATADDLVQEAWVSVLARRAAHDWPYSTNALPPQSVGSVRPWLAGLVRNLAHERLRGEARRARREHDVSKAESIAAAQDVVDRLQTFRQLAEVASRLREPYRSAILLRFFDGLSAEEIARREGVPAATIRSRQKRGLAELREHLDRHYGDRETWTSALIPMCGLTDVARRTVPVAKLGIFAASALALVAIVSWVRSGSSANEASTGATPLVRATRDTSSADAGADLVARASRAADEAPARTIIVQPEPTSLRSSGPSSVDAQRARVHLRIVDRTTREPVPDYAIAVEGDGTSERLTSDVAGHIETIEAFPIGSLSLHLEDHALLAQEREERRAGTRTFRWTIPFEHRTKEVVDLPLDVGPSFEVELTLPDNDTTKPLTAADFEALLAPGTDVKRRALSLAPVRAKRPSVSAVDPESQSTSPVAFGLRTLRAWVRFAPEASDLSGTGPWLLFVSTRDARLRGRTLVMNAHGRAQGVLHVHVEPTANLHVRFGDSNACSVRARVTLLDEQLHVVGTDAGAIDEARFVGIAPGPYTLHVEPFGAESRIARVNLAPQDDRELAIEVGYPLADASIHGRVYAPGASFQAPVTLTLRDPRNGVARTSILRPENCSNRAELSFSLDDLPLGEYELSASSNEVWRWNTNDVRVRAPTELVEFEALLAPDGTNEILVKCFDDEDGARVDRFTASIAVGMRTFTRETNFGTATLARFVPDQAFTWHIAAHDYASSDGDERSVSIEGGRRILRVNLRREP